MEHIDWVPRLWRAGVIKLTPIQRSVYFDIINETYALGDHPAEDYRWLSGVCNMSQRQLRRVVAELIDAGKLSREEGPDGPVLVANRTKTELKLANDRVNSYKLRAVQRGRNSKKQGLSNVCSPRNNNLQNNNPPYPQISDQEGEGEKTLDGWASVLASLPQPEGPEPAGSGAPGETDGPGNGPEPPSPSRASPRQRRTNPRAAGTSQRAMGTNHRAVGTNPRERLPDVILPDGPEQVRKAFLAVAVEHGPTKYAQFMAGLPVTMDGDKITITAPGRFECGWISDRYLADMTKAAGCEIEVVVGHGDQQ